MSNETVTVKILDKEYQVACAPDERTALLESAQLLDERMRTIQRTGSVIGLERIAVMAALNLSHELLEARQPAQSELALDTDQLERLHHKLDHHLERFE